jgi:hypothetical protein
VVPALAEHVDRGVEDALSGALTALADVGVVAEGSPSDDLR